MPACASLTTEGGRVKLVDNPSDVRNCVKLGRVRTESSFSNDAGWTMLGNHNSDVKMRNLAAEEGGDTLLITKNEASVFGSDRAAIIYKCERGTSPVSPP